MLNFLFKPKNKRRHPRVEKQFPADWTSAPDVEEWIPVTLTPGSPSATLPVATPCRGRGAGALSRLVRADAWWRHPIGQGQIHRGELIEVFPIAVVAR